MGQLWCGTWEKVAMESCDSRRQEPPGIVASQAVLSSTGADAQEGENVWTDPRLVIGQMGLEERGLLHGSCKEE